jgi:hypothetical protein
MPSRGASNAPLNRPGTGSLLGLAVSAMPHPKNYSTKFAKSWNWIFRLPISPTLSNDLSTAQGWRLVGSNFFHVAFVSHGVAVKFEKCPEMPGNKGEQTATCCDMEMASRDVAATKLLL